MPSPKKKLSPGKKKLLVMYPSRGKSARIKSKIKEEETEINEEEEPSYKKVSGKVKKKEKANVGKRRDNCKKMTVMMLAAARKRKLNGEDDDKEPIKRVKKVKKKGKKKVAKKIPCSSDDGNDDSLLDDDEIMTTEDENYDVHPPVMAVKREGESDDEDDDDNDDDDGEITEDNEEETFDGMIEQPHHGMMISEEHHYMQQRHHNEIDNAETSQIEVPAEQVQAELQEDQEDNDDDEEDIDENLFFGIPEQQSPDLGTCTHCKGKFRKEDVHEHMLTCPERYVQCRECGKILSNLQTLERHHKRFHLKIREVPCTLCDKMFIDEAAARKHLKTVHFKVKNFHCPHCDKSFSQRNKLTYHVRTHSGEKPYSCAECGRSFSLLWNLKTHLRTHTGEKPYACDTCGRRFTQKQNMTSHLTTHRKPKAEKGFRSHFPGELDDYDTNPGGIISTELSYTKQPKASYRAFEQAKQLAAQSIGGAHYVLGDMQNIEIHTVNQDDNDVGMENGLGLLSSVARKGDTDVQVDGIVNMDGNNSDQIVEVLIRSGETDQSGNAVTTLQLGGSANQSKIIIDPSTQNITDGDGNEIQLDSNTAAGLSNILQNPDVLAAINNAASTNKFIVIGPVSMFDNSESSGNVMAVAQANDRLTSNHAFSQEELSQAALTEDAIAASQVSSQSVNDSISATAALAAVESYLHGEQASSSLSKPDEVTNNISSKADSGGGPSRIVQSAISSSQSRGTNLTICMPSMSRNTLKITHSGLSNKADSTHQKLVNSDTLETKMSTSSEVSSSIEEVDGHHSSSIEEIDGHHPSSIEEIEGNNLLVHQPDENELVIDEEGDNNILQSNTDTHQSMEVESTSQIADYHLSSSENIGNNTNYEGAPDSTGGLVIDHENGASSSDEPILLLSTDENGQPQIIVKMPDGSETIMSDPALAESLIQVPTITNAEMVKDGSDAEAVQNIEMNIGNNIDMRLSDQGVTQSDDLPTQSTPFITPTDSSQQYASQSDQGLVSQSGLTQPYSQNNISDDNVTQSTGNASDADQVPDQSMHSLPVVSSLNQNNIDFQGSQEYQISDSSAYVTHTQEYHISNSNSHVTQEYQISNSDNTDSQEHHISNSNSDTSSCVAQEYQVSNSDDNINSHETQEYQISNSYDNVSSHVAQDYQVSNSDDNVNSHMEQECQISNSDIGTSSSGAQEHQISNSDNYARPQDYQISNSNHNTNSDITQECQISNSSDNENLHSAQEYQITNSNSDQIAQENEVSNSNYSVNATQENQISNSNNNISNFETQQHEISDSSNIQDKQIPDSSSHAHSEPSSSEGEFIVEHVTGSNERSISFNVIDQGSDRFTADSSSHRRITSNSTSYDVYQSMNGSNCDSENVSSTELSA